MKMSNLDIVFGYTKKIEHFLKNEFKAEGRGLHTIVTSVEYRLPIALVKKIRWIATIRNNMAHTEGFELDNPEDFKASCESVLTELEALIKEGLRLVGQKPAPVDYGIEAKSNITKSQANLSTNSTVHSQGRSFFSVNANVINKPVLTKSKQDVYSKSSTGTSVTMGGRRSWWVGIFFVVCGFFAFLIWQEYGSLWNVSKHQIKGKIALAENRNSTIAKVETKRQTQGIVDLDQAYRDIDDGVFAYIAKNTKIWLDNQQLGKNENGTYDVQVMLHWEIPENSVLNVLNKYFVSNSEEKLTADVVDFGMDYKGTSYGVIIPGFKNKTRNKKYILSANLYKYLVSKKAIIKVSIGKRSTFVTIAGGRQCLVTCNGSGDTQFQIQLSNRDNPQYIMFGDGGGEQNPVIIKGLTMAEFKSVKMITTSVEVNSR